MLRRVVSGCVRTLSSLARLPRPERALYARAWWMLLVCRLRLRFPRLLRGQRLVSCALAQEPRQRCSPHSVAGLALLFRRAQKDQIVASPCLPRSVALLLFLLRHGVRARLELGLRRDATGLTGHAWVVHEGEPVNDSSAFVGSYVKLLRAESCDTREPSVPSPPRG